MRFSSLNAHGRLIFCLQTRSDKAGLGTAIVHNAGESRREASARTMQQRMKASAAMEDMFDVDRN